MKKRQFTTNNDMNYNKLHNFICFGDIIGTTSGIEVSPYYLCIWKRRKV